MKIASSRGTELSPPERVSVVIPCRNGEKYLAEAITSVIKQTRCETEVIVVDDGSTDHTPEIAARFGDRIRLHRQPSLGAGAARNAGIDMASGAFLAFLDADDLWPPDSLACRLDAFADEPKLELVTGRARQFVSPDLEAEHAARLHCPDEAVPARVAGTTLVRRGAIDRVGRFPTDVVAGETLDWFMRADEVGLVCRMLDDVVLWRRLHTDNMGVVNRNARSDYLRVVKQALDRRRANTPTGSHRDPDHG